MSCRTVWINMFLSKNVGSSTSHFKFGQPTQLELLEYWWLVKYVPLIRRQLNVTFRFCLWRYKLFPGERWPWMIMKPTRWTILRQQKTILVLLFKRFNVCIRLVSPECRQIWTNVPYRLPVVVKLASYQHDRSRRVNHRHDWPGWTCGCR